MPNLAFVLILSGILLVYVEFVWVGKLVFGVTGAIAALSGATILASLPHTRLGMMLIAGAVLCFAMEAAVETKGIGGIAGSFLCGWGFWKFCAGEPSISPAVAFPLSAVFGIVTTGLLAIAKRARRNKISL